MKYLIAIWSIFLTIGCGPRLYPIEMNSAKEFSVYRAEYSEIKREALGQETKLFPIVFGSLFKSKDRVEFGKCFVDGASRWIVIDEIEWEKLNETSRKELIFHEMIHCDLDFLVHVNGIRNIMDASHQYLASPEASLRGFFNEYKKGLYK